MSTYEIRLKEAKKMEKELEKRRAELSSFKEPYRKASIVLDSWVQRRFKTEGNGTWQAFKLGGRIKDGKLDTTAKLLQDTGLLRASFKPFATKNNAGIGSELKYSKAHNLGLKVPERRILPIDIEVMDKIEPIFDSHVKSVTHD